MDSAVSGRIGYEGFRQGEKIEIRQSDLYSATKRKCAFYPTGRDNKPLPPGINAPPSASHTVNPTAPSTPKPHTQ
jgi:hypothetical protein